MAVDFDEGNREELAEWEERVVGNAYKVVGEGELGGRVFKVKKGFESTETIEGQRVTGRSFQYEWLDTDTEEVSVEQGTATITTASGSEDDPSLGVEQVSDHKTKVNAGIYQKVNDGDDE